MSRERSPGDGPKCGCGRPAVWSGFCQMVDGKGYCPRFSLQGQVSFDAKLTLKCPFCSGTISADDGKETGTMGVVHTMPMCERFEKLEPDRFLAVVNAELLRRKGIGYG